MDIASIVDSFLLSRKADGCTPKTILWHQSSLKTFTGWLRETGLPLNPQDWTTHQLREYVVWLQQNESFTPNTVTTKVQSLLAFARWLHEEEFTTTNKAARIKKPKIPTVQKPPFSDIEVKRLLDGAKKNSLRDYAIFCLMFDSGLRANEVCSLQLRNVVFPQGLLTVHGKGQKDRVAPFSPMTARAIQKYVLKERGESNLDNVFLSQRGDAMTPNGLLQMMRRLSKTIGVEHVHPHKFRHTFAINYLRNGGDPLTLQRILGHTTMQMTAHYTNFNNEDLYQVHTNASPLTNLLKQRRR